MLKPSTSLRKPLFGLSSLFGRLVERTQPDDAHVGALTNSLDIWTWCALAPYQ